MIGSAKPARACLVPMPGTPLTAASTGTMSAVTVMCRASVNHRMATNSRMARPLLAGMS